MKARDVIALVTLCIESECLAACSMLFTGKDAKELEKKNEPEEPEEEKTVMCGYDG